MVQINSAEPRSVTFCEGAHFIVLAEQPSLLFENTEVQLQKS